MAERIKARQYQIRHEKDTLFQAERRLRRLSIKGGAQATFKRTGLSGYDRKTRAEILHRAIEAMNESDAAAFGELQANDNPTAPTKVNTSPHSLDDLLQSVVKDYEAEQATKKRIFAAARGGTLTTELRETFESVGIGGLKREPAIDMSGPLFRWRFLMMRIPDLERPSNFSDVSFRPCIVWDGFWSLNDEGDPELSGLELYPCTRHADNFSWKMGIEAPLHTKSERSTFLIPELLIRAPISAEYFQPQQPHVNGVRNLRDGERAGFETKIKIFDEHTPDGPTVYGLQERPKDWLPIEDPSFFELPKGLDFSRRHSPGNKRRGNGKKGPKGGRRLADMTIKPPPSPLD